MNTPDNLEQLWQTQPVQTDVKGEEMRQLILQKTEKFDRKIQWRNIREVSVAVFLAGLFGYFAWRQPNGIARLGNTILCATFVWIVYYIWRHGSGPADPNPDQTAAGYQLALISKIDHQIRLLRNVKLWYLLPMYVGLMVLGAAGLAEHATAGAVTWRDAVGPIIYTLVMAFIWWLNEAYAVRKLEQWRVRLESGMQEGESHC